MDKAIGRIKKRYFRETIAHLEGQITHHGDCYLYNADAECCNGGLHHDLYPLSDMEIAELYPAFFAEIAPKCKVEVFAYDP